MTSKQDVLGALAKLGHNLDQLFSEMQQGFSEIKESLAECFGAQPPPEA
jgi:hypothetical protein